MKRYISILALLLASLLYPQDKANINSLVQYGDKMYKIDDDKPYTGKVFDLYKSNGNKKVEGYYKDGLRNRKWEWWSEDGKMDSSGTYKDGKRDRLWAYSYHKDFDSEIEENYIEHSGSGSAIYGRSLHISNNRIVGYNSNSYAIKIDGEDANSIISNSAKRPRYPL